MDNTATTGAASLEALRRARAQLHQTETVATQTTHLLAAQREQIQRVKAKTEQIDTDLSVSQRLLTKLRSWWR